jgi:hypothetical protein
VPATLVFCQRAQSRFRAGKRRTSEGHNLARVQAFNHIGEGRDVHDISFGWFWRAFSGRADADAACTRISKILLLGVQICFDAANSAVCIFVDSSVVVSTAAGWGRFRERQVKMLLVTSDSLAGGRAAEQ